VRVSAPQEQKMQISAGIMLGILSIASALSPGAAAAAQDTASARVSSPYGIPGAVPAEHVWARFLATSNLQKTSAASLVTNTLFDAEGNLDPAACKAQAQAVRDALAEIPISTGLWLYGGRCAELSGDQVLAAQSEDVLTALIKYALTERELARHIRPIRVLGENDVYAILELTGEKVLFQFYEIPVTGRYMRLMVTLYDEEAKRESTLYFDFLDTYAQLARDQPEIGYPEGRRQFAQSLLEGMKGSAAADIASDAWAALRLPEPAARTARLLELGNKEGDYKLWVGLMCSMIEPLACAEAGVDLLLPYAEAKYADAYVALAIAYAEGRGVERDEAAARDLLRAANDEVGAPRAEVSLQIMLQTLNGETRLHPLVADTLRAAAEAGDPLANLIVAPAEGDWSSGVPAAALPMLQRASKAGIANAKGLIGRHDLQTGSTEKGLLLLEQAANAGDSAAAGVLGMAYARGDGVERDSERALQWLNLAAQDGDKPAMRALGAEYRRLGGKENEQRSDRWLSNATLLGDLQAAHELAEFLATEPEGARDPRKRALLLFNALIDEHDSDNARVDLAIWYLTANNEVRASDKAEPLLRVAAKRGDKQGRMLYVVYALQGRLPGADLKQSRVWLEEGIDGTDPATAIGYSSTLMYALPELRDVPRALATLTHWWEKEHNPRALNELAWARCTSPDADIFSAQESARLGPALAALDETRDNPAWLDTVAACHAAAGNFAEAVEVQAGALATVEQALGVEHPMSKGLRKRLASYEAGERISEKPFPDSGG
jgi:TPR repeat protein